MDIRKRLILVLLTIFFVIMVGSFGYYILYGGEQKFIDCMYMTVISLTGVGYGEIINVTGNVPSQIFTMILITFGMGIIFYGISTLTVLMIEGELSGILRKKKMAKKIKKLAGHYIICGGGKTGQPLIMELIKNRETIVLIEIEKKHVEKCKKIDDLLYIIGDATEDRNLVEAGIDRAAGIIVCLPSDKDNLYITMTARMLNPDIRIISRMTDPKLEPKLKKAGANQAVSPNTIGALRMASEVIRPTVVNFLDNMLRSRKGTWRINQLTISKDSILNGKTIMTSGIRDKYSLLILGAKADHDEIAFNPDPMYVLKTNMILIVMGEIDDIEKAKNDLGCFKI